MLAKVCSRPFLMCISRASIAFDESRESAASNICWCSNAASFPLSVITSTN